MAKFTHHIFVCGNQRPAGHPRGCCSPDGTDALRSALKSALQRRRLQGNVRANAAGCLDQCERGPTVVIYPQAIWYGNVQPEDAQRIVDETVIGGRVLDDLVIADNCLNSRSANTTNLNEPTP